MNPYVQKETNEGTTEAQYVPHEHIQPPPPNDPISDDASTPPSKKLKSSAPPDVDLLDMEINDDTEI